MNMLSINKMRYFLVLVFSLFCVSASGCWYNQTEHHLNKELFEKAPPVKVAVLPFYNETLRSGSAVVLRQGFNAQVSGFTQYDTVPLWEIDRELKAFLKLNYPSLDSKTEKEEAEDEEDDEEKDPNKVEFTFSNAEIEAIRKTPLKELEELLKVDAVFDSNVTLYSFFYFALYSHVSCGFTTKLVPLRQPGDLNTAKKVWNCDSSFYRHEGGISQNPISLLIAAATVLWNLRESNRAGLGNRHAC